MTIVSEYFREDFPTGTFYWKLNCETTENDFDISTKLTTIDPINTITIEASDIYPSRTTFPDGVYSIRIVVDGEDTVLVDDVEILVEGTHEETYCIFIGTTTNCKAYKAFNTSNDVVIEYLLKSLQIANDCDCDCDNSCIIYEALLDRISNPTNMTNDDTNCGCS